MSDLPKSSFLQAEWRYIAMLNYEVDPKVLLQYLPTGTELDYWGRRTFVSIVAFLFKDTKVRGLAIPFHRNFEEVNLRFYVRRRSDEGWRRGVVFIKEIVPRWAIAFAARSLYNEQYIALPMKHTIQHEPSTPPSVTYSWRFLGKHHNLQMTTKGDLQPLKENSEEEFIAEHYWGYSSQRDRTTMEYEVRHPKWSIWSSREAFLDCDTNALYGAEFAEPLSQAPTSAFLADGSRVEVFEGRRLEN